MKSWMMTAIIVLFIIALFFTFTQNNPGLSPRMYKPLLPDLTTSIFVNSITNMSYNGTTQFLINYTVDYRNIGNLVAFNISASSGNSFACVGGPWGGSGGGFVIPSLAPNQIITFAFSNTLNCHGNWTGYSAIDISNNITESNENNNNANIAISV